MHDESYKKGTSSRSMHTHKHVCTETHRKNGRLKCGANGHHLTGAGYKYINNTHRQSTHTITAKTQGLISHTQLVHLVNVKRAVIVNYIPI